MPTIREWQLGFGGVASRSRTGRRVQLASVASPLRRHISAVLGVGLFMRLLPAAAEETRVARVGVIIQRSIVPGGPAGPLTRALREKQAAVAQAWLGMFAEGVRLQQQFALSLLTGAKPSQHAARAKNAASRIASTGLAPFHRKAVANAKRLARTKLR